MRSFTDCRYKKAHLTAWGDGLLLIAEKEVTAMSSSNKPLPI